jgi:hypothetical protein
MRAAITVTGVLGLGTALVFGAAALVSLAFPNGGTVAAGWNGGGWGKGGVAVPMPAPMAVPAPMAPAPVIVDDSGNPVLASDAVPAGK